MERREKTDFILEQIRLCLAKKDYTRALILSRKINIKFFEDVANQDLKLRYYNLMIEHAIYSDHFLKACQHYRHLLSTPSIKENVTLMGDALKHICVFIILASYDNEQSDLLHRITTQTPELQNFPLLKDLLKGFTTPELMRSSKVDEIYGVTLKAMSIFNVFNVFLRYLPITFLI